MKRLLLFLLALTLCLSGPAQKQKPRRQKAKTAATTKNRQTTKKQPKQTERQRLEAQKRQVQQQQAEARKRQKELEAKVKGELQHVQLLDGEIASKRETIDSIHNDIARLDVNMQQLDSELVCLQNELSDRKDRYMKSLRFMYRNRKQQNRMMFVFSAKNFNQMYRRLRFSNDYSTYQKTQGEAVKLKSEQVKAKQQQLAAAKNQKTTLLSRREQEHRQMEQKQNEQKTLVESLQKEQKTVAQLLLQQQKEERQLDALIEREIKAEIARAEAEARRRAAEEARRKAAEEARKAQANKGKGGNGSQRKTSQGSKGAANTSTPVIDHYELPSADRALSGSFEKNKGRLPVPITGAYNVIRGMGTYSVSGTRGVVLESKGMYFRGQEGAQARCIFNGQVSYVSRAGSSYVVMVRHGRYISVYCNLATVSVSKGQQVKTNQILGTIDNTLILHFQLRHWRDTLDPRKWLGR